MSAGSARTLAATSLSSLAVSGSRGSAVLSGYFCFGSLDVGGIVRIFPRGRAIASLFETYEFRAHLRARQWARCGLRESRYRTREDANSKSEANERFHEVFSFST